MIRRAFLTLLLACAVAAPAAAGRSCDAAVPTIDAVRDAGTAALRTMAVLKKHDAEIAVLARAGSDISKYGLRYTHAAFVLRERETGRWLVRHQLNRCGHDTSAIFDQGMMNFFLDDPYAYDALVLIPTPEVQARLKKLVASDLALGMHEPRYNMIANPYSTMYQNSNQWLLEIAALALVGEVSPLPRQRAQQFLKGDGYQPSYIGISGFERLGAGLFRANVSFADHDEEANQSGRFPVVSVRSIKEYLLARGYLAAVVEVPGG